jgi:hypothetical protein
MFTETIAVEGNLKIDLFDENQNIKDTRYLKNLVVATGKAHITARMTSNTTAVMSHMAIGSANVAPTTSDTALGTETARVSLDSANVVSNTVTYIATYGAGVGTGPITEAGVFNDASTGTMLCRTRFDVVNKGASDIIVITWNVSVL